MEETRAHKNLNVWKGSIKLSKMIYQITACFPSTEQFGLISQMRRAVVSIPSNLAEGAARSGRKEFLQFINIAQGSLSELDAQVELSKELGFLDQKDYDDIVAELKTISKQLFGLTKAIKGNKTKD